MTQVLLFTGSAKTNLNQMYTLAGDAPLYQVLRPLGAYQIASILRDAGYSVQVIDRYHWFIRENKEDFVKLVEHHVSKDTLWIGWSNTFFEGKSRVNEKLGDSYLHEVEESIGLTERGLNWLTNLVKNTNPNIKFLVGGAKTWRWRQEGAKFFDYYVEGYADQMALDLTNYLAGKGPKPKTIINDDGSETLNYDKKGSSFDFINHVHKWHESDHIETGEALPLEVARGCIFRCAYCSFPLNGKKKLDFIRTPESLKEELTRNWELYGVNHYLYSDDTHNDSVEKLEFLYNKVYSQLPFPIYFSTYLRLDLLAAHPHTMQLLKDSGLIGTFFGIESFNYEANKTVGKAAKEEKIWENLWKCKEVWGDQVKIHSGLLAGLPNDDEESIMSWGEKAVAADSPIDFSMVTELHIFPNFGNDSHWMNKIELDPEKYGYKFDSDGINYTNNKGLTKIRAREIARVLSVKQWENKTKKLGRSQPIGWYSEHRAKTVGLTLDQYKQMEDNEVMGYAKYHLKKYAKNLRGNI